MERRRRYIERQIALEGAAVNVDLQGRSPEGSGPVNRHGMPKLPVGQHEVRNWPVLDLGDMPQVELDEWRLDVAGEVDNPVTLTWTEFLALPQVDDTSDFHCVTTWSRYDNHWRGVRFKTIAELAVPRDSAHYVLCTGYDVMPGSVDSIYDKHSARARDRRRRAARAHVGGQGRCRASTVARAG